MPEKLTDGTAPVKTKATTGCAALMGIGRPYSLFPAGKPPNVYLDKTADLTIAVKKGGNWLRGETKRDLAVMTK